MSYFVLKKKKSFFIYSLLLHLKQMEQEELYNTALANKTDLTATLNSLCELSTAKVLTISLNIE